MNVRGRVCTMHYSAYGLELRFRKATVAVVKMWHANKSETSSKSCSRKRFQPGSQAVCRFFLLVELGKSQTSSDKELSKTLQPLGFFYLIFPILCPLNQSLVLL